MATTSKGYTILLTHGESYSPSQAWQGHVGSENLVTTLDQKQGQILTFLRCSKYIVMSEMIGATW